MRAVPHGNQPLGPLRSSPLPAIAATAAFLDLACNRIALRILGPAAREFGLWLANHGRFLRALAVVAAIATMWSSLVRLVRRDDASLAHRLAAVAVGGLFVPGIAALAVLPRERIPTVVPSLVVIAGHALVAMLGSLSWKRWRRPSGRASLAAGLASLATMSSMLVAQTRSVVPAVGAFGWVLRQGSEWLWLLAPLCLLPDRTLLSDLVEHRRRALTGLVLGLATLGLAVIVQMRWGNDAARIAYGAFRLAALPAGASWAYGLPLGLSIALASVACSSPSRRLACWAVLAWIAAGVGPRAPATVTYGVLAAFLLERSASASGTSEARARAQRPAASTDSASSSKSADESSPSDTLSGRDMMIGADRAGRPDDVGPPVKIPGCHSRI